MNSKFIEEEITWFTEILFCRIKIYFNQDTPTDDIYTIQPPTLEGREGAYVEFIKNNHYGFDERVFLITSFIPYLKPQLFDCFNVKNSDTGMRFVEFGCIEKGNIVIPSIETVLFILAGCNITSKLKIAGKIIGNPSIRNCGNFSITENDNNSFSSMAINPTNELLDKIILEKPTVPEFSGDFPARKLTTSRSWKELVLEEHTLKMVEDIKMWVLYGERVRTEWGLSSKIKPGYRALFYGPSGSGKTFTASLLGEVTGKEVYCVDLSMIVSKYIGETEKNLSKIFKVAENKNWILFFDEADALFGKRTGVKDSHDRYANQEVAYLLQRIECYNGLVVLSTNLRDNIDEAFSRRFQAIIHFPMPNAAQRKRLWEDTFSDKCVLENTIDLDKISEKYELSGGSILNVVEYCSIMAISNNSYEIKKVDLMEGIRRELSKEGKVMSKL